MITGANHGIGAATLFIQYLRLSKPSTEKSKSRKAEPGENLYRTNQAKNADGVVDIIRSKGGRAEAWEVDLLTSRERTKPSNHLRLKALAAAHLELSYRGAMLSVGQRGMRKSGPVLVY